MSIVVKFGEQPASGVGIQVDELTYANDTNYVLGPLGSTPTNIDQSMLWSGGISQKYTQDYTVRRVTGGTDPGYYVCVSPSSTAPGGGAFIGGQNPGTGILNLLELSDTIQLLFQLA